MNVTFENLVCHVTQSHCQVSDEPRLDTSLWSSGSVERCYWFDC